MERERVEEVWNAMTQNGAYDVRADECQRMINTLLNKLRAVYNVRGAELQALEFARDLAVLGVKRDVIGGG
jgi:hypothetical protein